MSSPTPQQLRDYATELRELARTHGDRAGTIENLLAPVTRLDDDETWQGSYVDDVHRTLQGWVRDLRGTAEECRADARRWRGLAHDLEARADREQRGGTGDGD